MRWRAVTAENLWRDELTKMMGAWAIIFLQVQSAPLIGAIPGMPGAPISGRVMAIDGALLRLSQIGNEVIVPLSQIWYVMNPGQKAQEELTINAMSMSATKSEPS